MSFANFIRENSNRIHQVEGQLEMANIEIAFEKLSLLRIFQPGPSTIKGSAFSILPPFERAFEPSSYLFSSAPLSPRPS